MFYNNVKLSKLYSYYCMLFLLCNLLSSCIFTKIVYRLVIPVILLFGGFILLTTIKELKSIFERDVSVILLFLFILNDFVLVAFKSTKYIKDFAQLLGCIVYFFIVFWGFKRIRKKELEKLLNFSSMLIFVFCFIETMISIIMLLFRIKGKIIICGEDFYFGLIPRKQGYQLWGISGSPVEYSVLLLISIISSLYLWKKNNKFTTRLFIIFADFISWLALAAANANYFVLLFLAFMLFLMTFRILLEWSKGIKEILKTVIISILIVVIWMFLYKMTQSFLSNISSCIVTQIVHDEINTSNYGEKVLISNNNEEYEDVVSKEKSSKKEEYEKNNFELKVDGNVERTIQRGISSTRLDVRIEIWKEAFKLFLTSPLGVSNSNAKVEINYGTPNHEFSNLHNGYIQLLIATGIQGLFLIMLFLIIQFIQVVILIKREKSIELCVIASLCFAILVGELINGCFVLSRGLSYVIFWGILGFLHAFSFSKYSNSLKNEFCEK